MSSEQLSCQTHQTQRQRLVRSTNQRTIQGFFDACERAKQHVSEFHSTFPTFSGMFSVSYLPHNGPVSVRHSQQRDRARDGNDSHILLFTRLSVAPAYLTLLVRTGGPMMSRSRAFYEQRNGLPAVVDARQYPSGGTVVSAKATELHNASARGRSRARWADRARVSHCPRLEGATGPRCAL
jgi:hypothetical protein